MACAPERRAEAGDPDGARERRRSDGHRRGAEAHVAKIGGRDLSAHDPLMVAEVWRSGALAEQVARACPGSAMPCTAPSIFNTEARRARRLHGEWRGWGAKPPQRQISVTAFRSPRTSRPCSRGGRCGDAARRLQAKRELCRAPKRSFEWVARRGGRRGGRPLCRGPRPCSGQGGRASAPSRLRSRGCASRRPRA